MRRKNGPAGSCSRATCPVSSSMLRDELSSYYTDLLDGSYSCLDRLVLNANFAPCYSAGGFRWWWRQLHNGCDEELDDAQLMHQYSIYQVEYSRNLLFHLGGQMEQIFQGLIDRTRARLNVQNLKTIFGFKGRPHRDRKGKSPRLEVVVETPSYFSAQNEAL